MKIDFSENSEILYTNDFYDNSQNENRSENKVSKIAQLNLSFVQFIKRIFSKRKKVQKLNSEENKSLI